VYGRATAATTCLCAFAAFSASALCPTHPAKKFHAPAPADIGRRRGRRRGGRRERAGERDRKSWRDRERERERALEGEGGRGRERERERGGRGIGKERR
jgi:hypothetical protein